MLTESNQQSSSYVHSERNQMRHTHRKDNAHEIHQEVDINK